MTTDIEIHAQDLPRKHERITLADIYDSTADTGELFFSAFIARCIMVYAMSFLKARREKFIPASSL